jgi:hypothetical protein
MPPKKKQATTGTGSSTDGAAEFEKLGVFYLGRPYDLAAKQAKPGWLLYDSKDLVTPRGLRRYDGKRQDRSLCRFTGRSGHRRHPGHRH